MMLRKFKIIFVTVKIAKIMNNSQQNLLKTPYENSKTIFVMNISHVTYVIKTPYKGVLLT